MTAQEHHIAVTRSARYFQLGDLSATTRHVWFVCHGYGQLAEYFIRHFAAIVAADPTLVVVAPEGLSRFYLEGPSGGRGRIGATWMTREDRLSDINDYVGYLNQLSAAILAEVPAAVRVTVLGFSQGAATVSRWLTHAGFRPTRLVLWAGVFPPDMALPTAEQLLHKLAVTLVAGDEDQFITPADLELQRQFLLGLGVELEVRRFAGKHTLNAQVLRQLHS